MFSFLVLLLLTTLKLTTVERIYRMRPVCSTGWASSSRLLSNQKPKLALRLQHYLISYKPCIAGNLQVICFFPLYFNGNRIGWIIKFSSLVSNFLLHWTGSGVGKRTKVKPSCLSQKRPFKKKKTNRHICITETLTLLLYESYILASWMINRLYHLY